MQKNKLNILSTRPLHLSIISEVEAKGIEIDCISFIETEPVKNENIQEQIENLQSKNIIAVFTSMNAVEAVRSFFTTKPNWLIYAIGETTKKIAASTFSEENIKGTANNASLLAEAIIKDRCEEVYFFCGNQRRDELPDRLKAAGINLHEVIVYTTLQQANKISKQYDGILFFSPSAVQSFFSSNKLEAHTVLFAIGHTTADAIKQYTNNKLIIAERPGKETLVQTMIAHFSTIQKQTN